jgi:P27 family predicted phage terminase small subunit
MTEQKTKYTGQRGRKALTPEQKAAKNKVAGRGAPLVAKAELPAAPKELSPSAAAEWSRVGEYLLMTDRVAAVDLQSLAAYCSSYTLYCEAVAELLVGGGALWGYSNKRPKPSVYAEIAVKHGRETIYFARKFGMTARCRHLDQRLTGRPATPQEIHDLKGTEKRRKPRGRVAKAIEKFPESATSRPDWMMLSVDASREWERLTGQLAALDLWTPLDVAAVTVGCASFALVLKCISKLKEESIAIEVADSVSVQNPLLAIRSRHLEICQEVWKDYGMTPYDRLNFSRLDGGDDDMNSGPHRLQLFPDDVA